MADGHDLDPVEGALRSLAATVERPAPGPSFVADVVARVGSAAPRRAPRPWARPLAAAAVVVLVVAVTLAASPATRDAVARWFGLRDVRIERVPAPPTAPPATGAGDGLGLGAAMPLAEARRRVRFTVVVPAALGAPDAVHLSTSVPGGMVSLVYADGSGGARLLVTAFSGGLAEGFVRKTLGSETTVHLVDVDGAEGYWLEGAPHTFAYVGPGGLPHPETVRLAGSVLLWESGGVVHRVEGARSLEEALRVATSLR